MSFNIYTPLNKLNPSKIKWKIKVRAQAIWRGITRETKEFRGLNLILVDDSSFRIHAFINARFCYLFEKELEEGEIYDISNFVVQDYTGVEFHRCVRYEKHLFFAEYTTLHKSTDHDLKIPRCAFDFFKLADLENMEGDKRYLCDVVGIIKERTPLRDYVNDNKEPKKQKKMTITDGSCSVKVTFFDDFALSVEEALKKDLGGSIIIIIASAKIGTFQGELTLTNYPATRFYLNYNDKVVDKLRVRSNEPTFDKQLVHEEFNVNHVMKISEIKKLTADYIQKKVVCQVTVKKIEDKLQWFDTICMKCNIHMNPEEGRYQCSKCGRHYICPTKRFRVCILSSDGTGALPIILLDREVRRLIGKSVFDVELDMVEGSDNINFPPILKTFVNKQYQITLKISADNVDKTSDVYEACDIVVGVDDQLPSNATFNDECLEAEDEATLMDIDAVDTPPEFCTPIPSKRNITPRVRKTPDSGHGSVGRSVPKKDKSPKMKKKQSSPKNPVRPTHSQQLSPIPTKRSIKPRVRFSPEKIVGKTEKLGSNKIKNLEIKKEKIDGESTIARKIANKLESTNKKNGKKPIDVDDEESEEEFVRIKRSHPKKNNLKIKT